MEADADQVMLELGPVLRRLGLNPEALGATHVRDGVQQRLAARQVVDLSAYARLLQTEEDEFAQLAARLVVPESWFFRDVQPFRCLQHYVRTLPAACLLRLLSVPCGAGEEPFSMAMVLLDLGLRPGQFQVEGVDLSQAVLDKAAAAAYGQSSFRERDEKFVQLGRRYAAPAGMRTVMRDEVRAVVRFQQGNLVAPDFLAGEPPYQVIFCRNLFIYLEPPARATALANLHRLLVPGGLLYVGHVEASAVAGGLFQPFDPAFPFAFQPASGKRLPQAVEAAPARKAEPERTRTKPAGDRPGKSVWPTEPDKRVWPTENATGRPSLAEARRAADGGDLEAAAAECAALLRLDPANAAVHCLLGVVRQAQGNDLAAEPCFRRALYLEPRLHEALVHLALLAERRGDARQAANYRRRAARSEKHA